MYNTKEVKERNAKIRFGNAIINLNKSIKIYNVENSKSRNQKEQTLSNILKSIDAIGINTTTSTSVTISFTGFGLLVKPISTGKVCSLSSNTKVPLEIFIDNSILIPKK